MRGSPSAFGQEYQFESVQRRYTMRIPQNFRSRLSCSERLTVLNLNCVEMRMIKIVLCELFKLVWVYYDVCLDEFVVFANKRYDTSSNGLLTDVDHFNSGKRKFFFSTRIAKVWNKLPRDVAISRTVQAFRKQMNRPDVVNVLSTFLTVNR